MVLLTAAPAFAEAPLATEVYGATVESGLSEGEIRYGRLAGGEGSGTELTKFELARGFSKHFWGGVVAQVSREAGASRRLEAFEFEGRFPVGRVGGFDLAVMAEYEANTNHHADVAGGKLIVQRHAGPFDARLNLLAEKPFDGSPIALGYAALVTDEVVEHVHLGAMAVGGSGTTRRVTLRDDHFIGPFARLEIERGEEGSGEPRGGFELEAGYLVALGRARDDSKGQIRLGVDYEFRF